MTIFQELERIQINHSDEKIYCDCIHILNRELSYFNSKQILSPFDFKKIKSIMVEIINCVDLKDKVKVKNIMEEILGRVIFPRIKFTSEIESNKYEAKIKFSLKDNWICKTELLFVLLKDLQNGDFNDDVEARRGRLSEKYGIDTTTLNKYLDILTLENNNKKILDTRVKIDLTDKGYDNTVHPVFLALNLSEVFFLLEQVPNLAKENEELKNHADLIAEDIRRQLSPYALKMIEKAERKYNREHIRIYNYKAEYRKENKNTDIIYYLKSGKKCKIIFKDSPDKIRIGRINSRLEFIDDDFSEPPVKISDAKNQIFFLSEAEISSDN